MHDFGHAVGIHVRDRHTEDVRTGTGRLDGDRLHDSELGLIEEQRFLKKVRAAHDARVRKGGPQPSAARMSSEHRFAVRPSHASEAVSVGPKRAPEYWTIVPGQRESGYATSAERLERWGTT
jgi:hypothetical protein